jgi:hypothetical protein
LKIGKLAPAQKSAFPFAAKERGQERQNPVQQARAGCCIGERKRVIRKVVLEAGVEKKLSPLSLFVELRGGVDIAIAKMKEQGTRIGGRPRRAVSGPTPLPKAITDHG